MEVGIVARARELTARWGDFPGPVLVTEEHRSLVVVHMLRVPIAHDFTRQQQQQQPEAKRERGEPLIRGQEGDETELAHETR